MELPTSDLFELFTKLLPGFLAAAVFHALTPYPKRDVFERVIAALIFTLFAQLLVAAIHAAALWVGTLGFTVGAWGRMTELSWGAIIGIGLGVIWAHAVNNGWTHALLHRVGTTKRTSLPTQWFSAFSGLERFVVLHFKDGRRLMGWPIEWPDEPDSGHFVLQAPSWLMDDGTAADMCQVEAFLVSGKDVEAVEFLRFADDKVLVESAAKIESTAEILAKSRMGAEHERGQPTAETVGAKRRKSTSESGAASP